MNFRRILSAVSVGVVGGTALYAFAATPQKTKQVPLSDTAIKALAADTFARGVVPLGDERYSNAPKKGYIYLCNPRKENFGAFSDGPWIAGTTWNFKNKITVEGNVWWKQAIFSNVVKGNQRILSGNGLPTTHATGTFPIARASAAAQYDRNPNSIRAQSIQEKISANPVYQATPYCMGMEVGYMLSGVPLFNGFDATLRDAPAHELQDSCSGHPEVQGQYHYHSMSACLKDKSVKTVVGYALDGFPITGPYVTKNTYLTTDDLDDCHGITSEIVIQGKKKMMYHYVLTHDFPYSVSCFRAKPSRTGPLNTPGMQQGQGIPQNRGNRNGPPREATDACKGRGENSACLFNTPDGLVGGVCTTVPEGVRACVPSE